MRTIAIACLVAVAVLAATADATADSSAKVQLKKLAHITRGGPAKPSARKAPGSSGLAKGSGAGKKCKNGGVCSSRVNCEGRMHGRVTGYGTAGGCSEGLICCSGFRSAQTSRNMAAERARNRDSANAKLQSWTPGPGGCGLVVSAYKAGVGTCSSEPKGCVAYATPTKGSCPAGGKCCVKSYL